MPQLPKEKIESMQSLYASGMIIADIARQENVSPPTVYGYTKARHKINPETQQPFASLYELQDYQARQRVNPETKNPFASKKEYEDYQARQRVNPETGQKYASLNKLKDYRASQRQQRPLNQIVSYLIATALEQNGRNQAWLAAQLDVSRAIASRWASGKSLPRKSLQPKVFEVLGLPYRTVDDIPPETLDDLILEL